MEADAEAVQKYLDSGTHLDDLVRLLEKKAERDAARLERQMGR
jgi:hypothetical protein